MIKISNHILRQLPEFVKSNYPLFAAFIQGYYKFLEKSEEIAELQFVSTANEHVITRTTTTWDTNIVGFKIQVRDTILNNSTFTVIERVNDNTIKVQETVIQEDAPAARIIGGVLYYGDELNNFDIDRSIDLFTNRMIESSFDAIDLQNIFFDKKFTIKHLHDLISSRGSEESYKILFRLLFSEEITIKYPRDFLLTPSNGVWSNKRSYKLVERNDVNLISQTSSFIGARITGSVSGVTHVITEVQTYFKDGANIYEFFIAVEALNTVGGFVANDIVTIADTEYEFDILKTLDPDAMTITTPGTGYGVGQIFFDSNNSSVAITKVDDDGAILEIKLINFSTTYTVPSVFNLTNRGDGNAVITVGTSHLTKYYGEYIGTSGHLSSNDVLQDSHYWQLYSYVIRSSQSLRRWGDVVKKLLHPAGSVVFSESSLFTSEATDQVQNIKWVLINIFNSVVATVQARTLHSMKIRTRQPGTGGFTFYELDKYKFKYNRDLNYQTAVAADSVKTGVSFDWNYSGTINNGYWTGYWETPISHYKDVKINTPSNVVLIQQRDPYIKIYQST